MWKHYGLDLAKYCALVSSLGFKFPQLGGKSVGIGVGVH